MSVLSAPSRTLWHPSGVEGCEVQRFLEVPEKGKVDVVHPCHPCQHAYMSCQGHAKNIIIDICSIPKPQL